MKDRNHSIGWALAVALLALPATAAELVVHDFDDGSTQGWSVIGADSPGLVLDAPGPSGLPSDLHLVFEDTSNADPDQSLRLFAGPEIVGGLRGAADTCGALELDFRVLDDGDNEITLDLLLDDDPDGNGQGASPTARARFRLSRTLETEDGWVHVVVPLALLDGGELPSNADGAWEMTIGSPQQWNDLLAGADFLWLPLDDPGVSERFGVDNVRLVTGGCDKVGACSEIQVLPFHLADVTGGSGINTLLAVRNLTAQEVLADVGFYALSGERRFSPGFALGAFETETLSVRDQPLSVDADGFTRGFVRVVTAGNFDGSPVLAGDFFQVDTLNNFATGNRLLRKVCRDASIRFLDFGSGTRLLVYLTQPRGGDPAVDPPSFTVRAVDEAGVALGPAVPFWSADHALEIAASDVAPVPFGSLRFDFTNSLGGAVYAEYSAEGRFSVGAAGECEDEPSCGADCCPPGALEAVAHAIHYPQAVFPDCTTAAADALSNLRSFSYLNACETAHGEADFSEVLGARLVSCEVDPPLSPDSVVVDVAVCCQPR